MLCVVVPVAVYALGIFAFYAFLTRTFDPFHLWLIAATVALLVAPLPLAAADVSMPWCLVVLTLAPWVTVVGYELRGHEHNAAVIEALPQPEYGRSGRS